MNRTKKTARRLFDDWISRAPYQTMSDEFEIGSVEDAYHVQSELQTLHAKNRGGIAGRKIALSSKAMQQMVGINQPISGAIFSGDVARSGATIRASDFIRLGIEFELAFELKLEAMPQKSVHTSQSVHDYVAAVRPAFELIEDRNADYTNLDPLTIIADNAWCGGVVLGRELSNWEDLDLGDIPSVVHQTGEPIEETNTGAADPLGSLAWVLNHFSSRGISLAKGEHIITGSAVRTRFPRPGDKLTYEMADASVQVNVI